MAQILIIGAGAAGLFCGVRLAEAGCAVTILEQNEKAGKKLYITGKGRCNLTNACDKEPFFSQVVTNPRFLYSSFSELDNAETVRLFEAWGLRTKTERGARVFPASDHASDVIRTLTDRFEKRGGKLLLHSCVTEILTEEGRARGVICRRGGREQMIPGDAVVVATGGLSYPSTGSAGDGFRFARKLGISVTEQIPSLVPLCCPEEYVKELQGLSLKNVELTIRSGKKVLYREFGEMMFTHFGITGPLVLTASARIGRQIGAKPLAASIDLKPAVDREMLDKRILRLAGEMANRSMKNVLPELYPAKLIPVMFSLTGIDPEKKAHDLTRKERESLIEATKAFPFTISALRGWNEAVVTKGGISVKEIRPQTMESKQVSGLYWIGEVLDLDACTGGFNLQIAWTTANAAAQAIIRKEGEDT